MDAIRLNLPSYNSDQYKKALHLTAKTFQSTTRGTSMLLAIALLLHIECDEFQTNRYFMQLFHETNAVGVTLCSGHLFHLTRDRCGDKLNARKKAKGACEELKILDPKRKLPDAGAITGMQFIPLFGTNPWTLRNVHMRAVTRNQFLTCVNCVYLEEKNYRVAVAGRSPRSPNEYEICIVPLVMRPFRSKFRVVEQLNSNIPKPEKVIPPGGEVTCFELPPDLKRCLLPAHTQLITGIEMFKRGQGWHLASCSLDGTSSLWTLQFASFHDLFTKL